MLCTHANQQVVKLFDLHCSTVHELDKRRLQDLLWQLPTPDPRHLVMVEFAFYKGHRYASVILDANSRRVLFITKDRSRKAIQPYFEAPGSQGCASTSKR